MGQTAIRDKKADEGQQNFIHLLPAGLLFGLVLSLVQPALPGKLSAEQIKNKTSAVSQQKKGNAQKKPLEVPGTSARQPKDSDLLKENRFLQEELTLAKNRKYYFVIDLKSKKIDIRARGMQLKSWTASQIRYSGKPLPLKVLGLSQKSALNPPKRQMIKPGEGDTAAVVDQEPVSADKNNQDKKKNAQNGTTMPSQEPGTGGETFQLEALEITDMPGNYELIFDNGLKISVRSPAGKGQKLRRLQENLSWYIFLPVNNFLKKDKVHNQKMILYFDQPRDAQGIYWAFIDGIQGIVWLP